MLWNPLKQIQKSGLVYFRSDFICASGCGGSSRRLRHISPYAGANKSELGAQYIPVLQQVCHKHTPCVPVLYNLIVERLLLIVRLVLYFSYFCYTNYNNVCCKFYAAFLNILALYSIRFLTPRLLVLRYSL